MRPFRNGAEGRIKTALTELKLDGAYLSRYAEYSGKSMPHPLFQPVRTMLWARQQHGPVLGSVSCIVCVCVCVCVCVRHYFQFLRCHIQRNSLLKAASY